MKLLVVSVAIPWGLQTKLTPQPALDILVNDRKNTKERECNW